MRSSSKFKPAKPACYHAGVEVRVGASGERHVVPAVLWAASFIVCAVGDALLGRWVLLPLFVAAFYGGMIVIDLVTYPVLSFWRGWPSLAPKLRLS